MPYANRVWRTHLGIFGRFWALKSKSLSFMLVFAGVLLIFKFGFPEQYNASHRSLSGDIALFILFPIGFIQDWLDFRKKDKKKK